MYKLINGYTKESLKAKILKNNTGSTALYKQLAESDNEYCAEGDVLNEYCVYFNPVDGNRCAVGCCIPDDFIEENAEELHEEVCIKELLSRFPELEESMPMSIKGLDVFQRVHDRHKAPGSLHDKLCDWIDNNTY